MQTQLETVTVLATVSVTRDDDVSRTRRAVELHAQAEGFGAFDRTRLITATSELARNMLTYGGGGRALIERVELLGNTGIRVSFADTGPGILDLEAALTDGFSSGSGLGLGLGGARRLVDELEIDSAPGKGTQVSILRWRSGQQLPSPKRSFEAAEAVYR